MSPAHEVGVFEGSTAAFTPRVDVVDGEIVPSHQVITLGTSGRLGAIPKDAPLLFTKRPRAVFPQKERFEQTAQDVNALLALTNLIRSLQNGK